ncbi:MAG: glycerol-3-phosphate 1-O-acyltransferase PlsY [Candidatus Phytoplasma sp.]|nr:glycerol-3-phosphate 1-O-acyltransferase PlsY [Phytoplasma sp.]
MTIFYIILLMMFSYLLGSIPFGLIIGKWFKKIDIREHGSKNVGSTNAVRVLGFKWGALTFLFDCFKGIFPVVLVKYIIGNEALYIINNLDLIVIYGAAAVIGHIYPIYIGFKGGKAVATSVGVVISISPVIGVSGIALFFIIVAITKYASLASIIATLSVGVAMWLDATIWHVWADKGPNNNSLQYNIVNLILVSALVLMIIIKHRKNIFRLIKGTENKFGSKKKKNIEDKQD